MRAVAPPAGVLAPVAIWAPDAHLMLSVEGAVTVVDEGGKVLGELTRADVETHSSQLRPLEIATATDVLEVKNGTR